MSCPACAHPDVSTLDRFLCMPDGWAGKRGPRSLSYAFGLDRRVIARHERGCLVGERREKAKSSLLRMLPSSAGDAA